MQELGMSCVSCILIGSAILIALMLLTCFLFRRLCRNKFIESSVDKAILITGCDSGLGLLTAKYFHRTTSFSIIATFVKCGEGASDSNAAKSGGFQELSELADNDATNGCRRRLHLHQLDLTKDQSIDALARYVQAAKSRKDFKHFWAVINNAGVLVMAEFDWQTRQHFNTVVDVNFLGPIKLTQLLIGHLIESSGRIINVSSVGDAAIFPGLSVYAATKAAVTAFSNNLRVELKKLDVHVVLIRPGIYTGVTSLLKSNPDCMNEMWANMSETKRLIYGDYFQKFKRRIDTGNNNSTGQSSYPYIQSLPDFEQFRIAVMAKRPPLTIILAQWYMRLLFCVDDFLPTFIKNWLAHLTVSRVFDALPSQQVNTEFLNTLRDEQKHKLKKSRI